MFRRLEPREYAQWDALVRKAPSGTAYHESRWLVPVCEATGDRLAIFGAFNDGELIGGIPVQVRKRGPFSLARRAFATPYSGLVVKGIDGSEGPQKLREGLKAFARRFSHTTLTFSPFLDDPAVVPEWSRREQATYLVKFGSLNGCWRSLASEVRNRIRKAEKLGITVVREFPPVQFFEMFKDLFGRQGSRIPLDEKRFETLLRQLETNGVARQYLARMPDGTACAACLIVHDGRRAYYSLAASHAELRATGAPSLLVWEVLRSFEGQLREFDFGGANIPHIAQFKSKFRGILVSYPETVRYRSGVERILIETAQRFRGRSRSGQETDD